MAHAVSLNKQGLLFLGPGSVVPEIRMGFW